MWEVFKKEIRSFLGSFIAYIVMGVFLAITGLFMWIIKGNNVLDLGVASLQVMFNIAPYILIFLVSAITMRSLSEERRLGTIEILTTRPVSDLSILMGKYLAAVALIAVVPGIMAHVIEEIEEGKPLRIVRDEECDYYGKPERAVPKK